MLNFLYFYFQLLAIQTPPVVLHCNFFLRLIVYCKVSLGAGGQGNSFRKKSCSFRKSPF